MIDIVEKIALKIEEEIKTQGRTMTYYAKKAGITVANLSATIGRMKKGETITVEKLEKIAKALEKPLSFFLEE